MRPFGQLSKRTNAVIHALLLIALWPGPVPVGHSHHDVPNSSLRVAELNRHLSRHHTTVTRQEAVADHEADTADWHIHWVVPGLGFAGCNGQQQVVSRDTAKADDAGTDLWQPVPPILIVALDLNESCEQPIILASASSFQLVGLLASRQSLPELMGSMRC